MTSAASWLPSMLGRGSKSCLDSASSPWPSFAGSIAILKPLTPCAAHSLLCCSFSACPRSAVPSYSCCDRYTSHMDARETAAKLLSLQMKERMKLHELLPVARAAANQMSDAGLKAGAAALNQLIFEIDGIEQEARDLIDKDPIGALRSLDFLIKQGL